MLLAATSTFNYYNAMARRQNVHNNSVYTYCMPVFFSFIKYAITKQL